MHTEVQEQCKQHMPTKGSVGRARGSSWGEWERKEGEVGVRAGLEGLRVPR